MSLSLLLTERTSLGDIFQLSVSVETGDMINSIRQVLDLHWGQAIPLTYISLRVFALNLIYQSNLIKRVQRNA